MIVEISCLLTPRDTVMHIHVHRHTHTAHTTDMTGTQTYRNTDSSRLYSSDNESQL